MLEYKQNSTLNLPPLYLSQSWNPYVMCKAIDQIDHAIYI